MDWKDNIVFVKDVFFLVSEAMAPGPGSSLHPCTEKVIANFPVSSVKIHLKIQAQGPMLRGKGESPRTNQSACFWSYSVSRQVIVGNQIEQSSSNGGHTHCDDLSGPYSEVVASQTCTSFSDETGIHGRT